MSKLARFWPRVVHCALPGILGLLSGGLLLALAPAAMAQGAPGFNTQVCDGTHCSGVLNPGGIAGARRATVTAVTPTRLDRQRRRNGVFTALPSPAVVLSQSQSQINAAGVECRVVNASLLGFNADLQEIYEVSCGSGMGYVVGASSPPTVTDCVLIAARAEAAVAADPAAEPVRCALSANQNVTAMATTYARQAGIQCDVDAAAMAGTSVAGNAVYEVGCKGVDGYWLERAGAEWVLTPCINISASANACRFTTQDEQAATAHGWLVGTQASACAVTNVRFMGANASGAFYETHCGAGDGYVARLDKAMALQQVVPCAEAAGIGGGCRLGTRPTAN